MALILGAIVWVVFGVVWFAVRGGVLSSCAGKPVGWTEEGGAPITAVVIGVVLWATAGVAAGRLPDRKERVILAYVGAYVAALTLFVTVIAPAIWGPFHCVVEPWPLLGP